MKVHSNHMNKQSIKDKRNESYFHQYVILFFRNAESAGIAIADCICFS